MCPPVGETHFNLLSAKLYAQLWRRNSCCQAARRCAQHVELTRRDRMKASGKQKIRRLTDKACTDVMVGSSLPDDGT